MFAFDNAGLLLLLLRGYRRCGREGKSAEGARCPALSSFSSLTPYLGFWWIDQFTLIIKHHHTSSFVFHIFKPVNLASIHHHLGFAGRRAPICTGYERTDCLQRYSSTRTDLHSHWCLIIYSSPAQMILVHIMLVLLSHGANKAPH
jgi:hypothetical protein